MVLVVVQLLYVKSGGQDVLKYQERPSLFCQNLISAENII